MLNDCFTVYCSVFHHVYFDLACSRGYSLENSFKLCNSFILQSALQQQDNINTFLLLGRVYIRLDQPMAALEIYKSGLDKFPGEVTLLTAIARFGNFIVTSCKPICGKIISAINMFVIDLSIFILHL